MTRLFRFGPALMACVWLGACANLIGLDKFDDNGGTAEAGKSGSAGKGGSGGSAGRAQGGSSGRAGAGGSTAGKAGGGGSAGTNAGAAGESGAGPLGGSGGSTSAGGFAGTEEGGASGATTGGSGGTGATENGGMGAGGESDRCSETIEIVTHGSADATNDTDSGDVPNFSYVYTLNPQIGSPALDYLNIDFYLNSHYDGDATGVFELGQGDEANYASCSRCVYIDQDENQSTGDAAAHFFAASGTMNIAADSSQMTGYPDVQFTDVLFREATIDFGGTNVSTYVPNGRCLHLTSASLVNRLPAGWTCPPEAYGSGDGCDCGCGVPDPDCSTSLVGACEYCGGVYDPGSCATRDDCSDVDLNDNSTCTPNQDWTCNPLSYGDGQSCDCGCGVVDADCLGPESSFCDACDDPSSCTSFLSGSCTDVAPTDNSQCD